RELHPHMVDEPDEPKKLLIGLLHDRAGDAVRRIVLELATAAGEPSRNFLTSLLEMLDPIADSKLDNELCELIASGSVTGDRVGSIAEFVLGRDAERAVPACLTRIDRAAAASADETAVRAAVALHF